MKLLLPKAAGRCIEIEDVDLPSLESIPESPPCTPCFPFPRTSEEAFVFQPPGHPKQALIDEEIWPPIFKTNCVRSAKKLAVRDSDVFVVTYPKCGTTWVQHICSQLLCDNYGPNVGKELCMTSPMIEKMGAEFTDNLSNPRLLKSHFTLDNIPKSSTAKYIFVARNPKDCLVSYFFHNCNFKIYDFANGDFNTFFELFVAGKLGFGCYFDHLKGWLTQIGQPNVLFMTYESMCADLETSVKKIGEFLGGRAAEIVNDEDLLQKVVEESTLESMKKNQHRWFPGNALHRETFIRKGGSRDWKNHFSREQSQRLDLLFKNRMAGTLAENWWIDEMTWDELHDDAQFAELDSLPRRNSQILDESHFANFRPGRRQSLESVSTGYGSVWSQ